MSDEQREALLDGWEEVAKGWGRQAERFAETVAPVTEAMLSAAELGPEVRVLELAAGPGELSRRAAALVAPTRVYCTDGVEAMVDVARELAEDDGITNIEFGRAQLESIDLPAATADVILCRYGLMFAVDKEAALRECRRVLAPGGKLVAAVQGPADFNPWISVPTDAAVQAGLLTPVEAPPGFSLGDPETLLELLGDVGFFDTTVEQVDYHWRYANESDWLGEKVDHSSSFAAMWREQNDAHRGALRGALRDLAGVYRQPDGSLIVPARAFVAVAEV
jgi:SAM-dependent methyltransferase